MMKRAHTGKRARFSWSVLVKAGLTGAFAFWFYLIWHSTADLNENLNLVSARYSAIHNVQVEYKNEVQEWKNVLLRSSSRESLDKNWHTFDVQYQKVATEVQGIVRASEIRDVNKQMQLFAEAHAVNYALYKNSTELLVKNGFDARAADAAVKGIDRPLLDYLEAADTAMQEEKKSINERLTAKAKNQIEQSMLILGLIALLVIWMPKW